MFGVSKIDSRPTSQPATAQKVYKEKRRQERRRKKRKIVEDVSAKEEARETPPRLSLSFSESVIKSRYLLSNTLDLH